MRRALLLAALLAGASACASRGAAGTHTLAAGDRLPDVEARNQDGALVHLSQYRGHPLVVYFYPKDKTAG
jgi:peroxiredoxin Q/BCP